METLSAPELSAESSTNSPQTREAISHSSNVLQGDGFGALLEAARAGDRRALDALLEGLRPRALSVALKVLRNPDDAEDAVQDAFLKVWRYLSRFEGRASFSTWLHRIVMNASLDLLRRQSCRTEAVVDEDEAPHRAPEAAHEETPERALGEAETGALVRTAMSVLSPVHQQALTLREFEDRSYEEIAVASRCPVGTVMSRLHHARKKLAEELRATLDDRSSPPLCAVAA